MSLIIFVFVITSITSTYMINYNYQLAEVLSRVMSFFKIRDTEGTTDGEDFAAASHKSIVFLGFFREASAILHEFELANDDRRRSLLEEVLVIDFNPEVYSELQRRGIASLYGDVAHMETLHHAKIHDAKLVVSIITDQILKGTNNSRLLKKIRQLCPHAAAVVTAESPQKALELYRLGADFVFIPRLHSSAEVAQIIELGLRDGLGQVRNEQIARLTMRNEVLA